MRSLLTLLCFMCIGFNSIGQNLKFQKVIATNNELGSTYEKAKLFVAKLFANSNESIKINDSSRIFGKGIFNCPVKGIKYKDLSGVIHFDLLIEFKKDKVRITISNLEHEYDERPGYSLGLLTESKTFPYQRVDRMLGKSWHNKAWELIKQRADIMSMDLIKSFENSLSEDLNEDW